MSSEEIVTLQFGNYSNFVGTHFWNLQYNSIISDGSKDENISKLFRESYHHQQYHQQYIPRMISFDVKDKLKTLKLDGTFESVEKNGFHCDDDYVTYTQTKIEKNDFLQHIHSETPSKPKDFNLDEKVNTWSDFMTYSLNENSLQLLKNRFDDDSSFTYHGLGQWQYEHLKDDIEDKLHYWVEECNSMQGFLIFTDMHDGFCGLTSKMLEEIHNEYRKKCFIPFINWPSSESSNDKYITCLNTALTFQSFKEHSSLFVLQCLKDDLFSKNSQTVSIPNISYNADLPYHSSAILASAIDSAVLPWGKMGEVSMSDICQHVCQNKWKLAGNAVGFPLATDSHGIKLFERMMSTNEYYGQFITSLFPLGNTTTINPMSQSIVFQDKHKLVIPALEPKLLQSLGLCSDVFRNNPQIFLDFFTERCYPCKSTASKIFYSKQKTNLSSPFPSILSSSANNNVTTMSSLFTSAKFYDLLSQLIKDLQNIKLNKFHLLQEFGFDRDLHEELLEDLFNLAQEYNIDNPFMEIST